MPVNAESIDALLPQTQCAKCGFAGCRPYAEAIAAGEADIDRCPPGGEAGVARLASLLGRHPAPPLNPLHGVEEARAAALIDESWCIGCTLCIQACPTDAIVGAAKAMHTVLTEHCSGCGLCVPPCPVDCIRMEPMRELAARGVPGAQCWERVPVADEADHWRTRHAWRMLRRKREEAERDARLAARAQEKLQALDTQAGDPAIDRKRAVVRAAIERARARRAAAAERPATLSRDGNG